MYKVPVILIFDIGKTNKKVLLFNEQYKLVYERSLRLPEIQDEDGDNCEDVEGLRSFLLNSFQEIIGQDKFDIRAINFSAYGASFVYLNKEGKILTPLYNYLKPYPQKLQQQFYSSYGGADNFSLQTASPVLGSLNSGMQLYRIKYEKPEVFNKMKYALHLPQYLSCLITGVACSDISSIGCHTNLWDFKKNEYHAWVAKENIANKLAPLFPSDKIIQRDFISKNIAVGVGLHDSSAALIPYLSAFHEPFILLSTGTWCISLNPFNHSLLSDPELHQDCLCYLTHHGNPVKASRLFAGHEHEQQVQRLAEHFNRTADYYKSISYDASLINQLQPSLQIESATGNAMMGSSNFAKRDLNDFTTYERAYHQLISDIIVQQVHSTKLVLKGTSVKRIFVDGGFSRNSIYMHLLANAFPQIEIFAATVAQASSLGAALAIHPHWNKNQLPSDLINLKFYPITENVVQ